MLFEKEQPSRSRVKPPAPEPPVKRARLRRPAAHAPYVLRYTDGLGNVNYRWLPFYSAGDLAAAARRMKELAAENGWRDVVLIDMRQAAAAGGRRIRT